MTANAQPLIVAPRRHPQVAPWPTLHPQRTTLVTAHSWISPRLLLATSNPPIRLFPIVPTLASCHTIDTSDLSEALRSSECRRLRISPQSPCCICMSFILPARLAPLSLYR